jgi:hypothetical protein
MEPSPLLDIKLGATPAPQVELLDPGHDSDPADPGLNVPLTAGLSDEGEAPYLRLRTSANAGDTATPTPMVDLTDLAVAMPTPPPVVEFGALPQLDPADETSVTPLGTSSRRSRVVLSRPRLAGLGVLAFSAGLLTAATAGVITRPARTRVAASTASTVATTTTATHTAGTIAAVPTAPAATAPAAPIPVLAAAEVPAPAVPSSALPEARPEIEPAVAAAAAADNATEAASAPAAKTASATTAKARGKTAAPVRARARTPHRNRSGTHVDSGTGSAVLASPATEADPDQAKETPPAATPKRGTNWVDPFVE